METEPQQPENPIQVVEPTPMARAEIESQIATARAYPRNITAFKDKLMSMANLDRSTAEGCYYALPRDGRTISGPSVRFAEIALSCYGNCIAQADVVREDDKFVYAVGMCRDLENNVAVRMTVRRRITKKNGRRYNDDMIATTANAACAIALRNAIFKIVPAAYIKEAFDQVKETAVGDAGSFANRRAEVLARLMKLGVAEERVLSILRRPSVDDITVSDVAVLIGLGTAVHDGETTLDEAFPPPVKNGEAGVNGLKNRLNPTPVVEEAAKAKAANDIKVKKAKAKAEAAIAAFKAKKEAEKKEPKEAEKKGITEAETEQTADEKLTNCEYRCNYCEEMFNGKDAGKNPKGDKLCPNCLTTDIVDIAKELSEQTA